MTPQPLTERQRQLIQKYAYCQFNLLFPNASDVLPQRLYRWMPKPLVALLGQSAIPFRV
ncbi:hypothetical protein [Coleofasciculus sp. FACHB-1120]|uniref:hypothetical protein n=1 Tax=Coleofasciculus sp. FACHB-1120 TaxID=2692783 RepID=UPI001685513C|nr:hypothetical protein [Coleofasciculus sp. FACHB-1120]MBD2743768.1 hypothetical protein [Coleofasciculus sp. FACHB-1120]